MYLRGKRRDVPRLQGQYKGIKLIAELPTLNAPEEKEELIVYLAATKEALNVRKRMIRALPWECIEERTSRTVGLCSTDGRPVRMAVIAGLILTIVRRSKFTIHFNGSSSEATKMMLKMKLQLQD
ncbi:hypothetical protein Tco_0603006 [Tanacetum coccineum]